MFAKREKIKFLREFINGHNSKTGHQFIIYLETGNEYWGMGISFEKENPNIVCLYSETQNEWENNERRAIYHYFHIDDIEHIQKSHIADNSPNVLIKGIV